jgi:hypothetical protein
VGLVLPVPAPLRGGRPQAARAGVGLPLALGRAPRAPRRMTWLWLLLAAVAGWLAGWHVRGLREATFRSQQERDEVAALLRRFDPRD